MLLANYFVLVGFSKAMSKLSEKNLKMTFSPCKWIKQSKKIVSLSTLRYCLTRKQLHIECKCTMKHLYITWICTYLTTVMSALSKCSIFAGYTYTCTCISLAGVFKFIHYGKHSKTAPVFQWLKMPCKCERKSNPEKRVSFSNCMPRIGICLSNRFPSSTTSDSVTVLEIRKKSRLSECQMRHNLGQLALYFSQKLVSRMKF